MRKERLRPEEMIRLDEIDIADLDDLSIQELLGRFHIRMDPFMKVMTQYQCAALEVETKFKVLNMSLSMAGEQNPIESIQTRIKSPDSIIGKLIRQHDPITLESVEKNIHDVAGVRVVCSFIDDIYRLEELFLKQDDIQLVRRKDYIQSPKESGYRSLHLVVQTPIFTEHGKKEMDVEVQMRTIAMDFWASLEHKLRYKKNLDQQTVSRLGMELEQCAQESARLDERMQAIRQQIYLQNDEVKAE